MLDILYRDEHFIAINKPPGLLVHRTKIAADVNEFAIQKLRNQIKQRVNAIHRLDRPTSGILLFAFQKEGVAKMQAKFKQQEIKKEYHSIVRGYATAHQIIDSPLKQKYGKDIQEALTEYHCLAQIEIPLQIGRFDTARYSYLSVEPHTGRTHQIRRHLAGINHPILGDKKHGDRRHNREMRIHYKVDRLLLHARSLQFKHPYTQELVEITAPLPSLYIKLCDAFDWKGIVSSDDRASIEQ